MSNYYSRLIIVALGLAIYSAQAEAPRLPTLGLYIFDDANTDVLSAIAPGLARSGYVEIPPRSISNEHFPVVIFQNDAGDDLEVVLGKGCTFLEFNSAAGTDGSAAIRRFNLLHDRIEQYLSDLPEPRPRIHTGGPIPEGCPNEF